MTIARIGLRSEVFHQALRFFTFHSSQGHLPYSYVRIVHPLLRLIETNYDPERSQTGWVDPPCPSALGRPDSFRVRDPEKMAMARGWTGLRLPSESLLHFVCLHNPDLPR